MSNKSIRPLPQWARNRRNIRTLVGADLSQLSVDSPEAIFARSRRRSSVGKAAQPHYAAAPWPDIAPPRTNG